jgi:glycosyltransferase involved in cell wall biosynthesis
MVFAGANPSNEMRDRAQRYRGVNVAGYVNDLAPLYQSASVAVVPVRSGAGIKFKTVEAHIAGVPVVATSVGAEGVGDAEIYWAIVDDAAGIADAIVAALMEPDAASARALLAQEWATRAFSAQTFEDRLIALYGLPNLLVK